ncbi:PI-PLC X domain-containing protein 1 [Esox lucius]|uniref:Phosphatidylinositol-specific phospholipase C X domain-containing protein n=1 Tax=Esox lucius TaxID=8010 RepID=A0AAY5K2P8_ESOLU|nr:PI-PLC X domain-containing protein 1 [Esox lucius]
MNASSTEHIPMHSDEEYQNYEEWMSALPGELWDIPLTSLAIPGSHDAMSYSLDIQSPLLRSESDTFRLLDGLFHCLTRPAIYRWATTQEKGIVEQLSMGIRYFDLRIAHKPNDPSNDLYFTHVIYTYLTVVDTMKAVASWLEIHPKEIIILACSHFEGLNDKLHEHFIVSLKKIFGSKLCPRKGAVLSLRSLWMSGYQVLLSYDDQAATRHQVLWPAIPYWWANQPTASGVVSYLESQKDKGRPDGFFVSGLNLTADRSFIALHRHQSLRTLTLTNWEVLRAWLGEQVPGHYAKSLNIIAGDFIGTISFVPLVITLNWKLLGLKTGQVMGPRMGQVMGPRMGQTEVQRTLSAEEDEDYR